MTTALKLWFIWVFISLTITSIGVIFDEYFKILAIPGLFILGVLFWGGMAIEKHYIKKGKKSPFIEDDLKGG